MPLLSASLDTYLFTSLAILPPLVYLLRRPSSSSMPRPPLRRGLSVLLVFHTLYVLYTLLIEYPPNLFTALQLPLTTSAERIRTVMLAHAGRAPGQPGALLPPALESLLTRLASFDMRTIYVRFGQRAIQSCTYCRTDQDFVLHFLPPTLLQYVRTASVLGVFTLRGSGRSARRVPAVGLLAAAAALEVYWLLTVRIDVPRDGRGVVYWHDLCWTARHVLFLLLPLAIHLIPLRASAPPPGAVAAHAIPVALGTLDLAITRLQALKLATGAVAREPRLHALADAWWAREAAEGREARADSAVQRVAEKNDLGFVEGDGEAKLREGARTFVDHIMEVLWVPRQQQ